MVKICFITLTIHILIFSIQLARIIVKRVYLKEELILHEWLLTTMSMLLTIATLDTYLLISGFYNTRKFTYILSYAYVLVGPMLYAIVMEIELKKLIKLKSVIIPFSTYVFVSNIILYLLYSGKLSPVHGGAIYQFTPYYTLFFSIRSLINIKRGLKKDPNYKLKTFYCLMFLISTTVIILKVESINYIVDLLTFISVIMVYSILPLLRKKNKYINSRQSIYQQNLILKRFKKIMSTESPYLDQECKLEYLADKLEVRRDQLSQVINTVYEKRFSDVINEYRINHSITLLNKNKNILDIAMDSGFSSKSSFYNYFRKITGLTPNEYKKQFGIIIKDDVI